MRGIFMQKQAKNKHMHDALSRTCPVKLPQATRWLKNDTFTQSGDVEQ